MRIKCHMRIDYEMVALSLPPPPLPIILLFGLLEVKNRPGNKFLISFFFILGGSRIHFFQRRLREATTKSSGSTTTTTKPYLWSESVGERGGKGESGSDLTLSP